MHPDAGHWVLILNARCVTRMMCHWAGMGARGALLVKALCTKCPCCLSLQLRCWLSWNLVLNTWVWNGLIHVQGSPTDHPPILRSKQPRSCNTGARITICLFSTFRNATRLSKYLATFPKRLPVISCGIKKHKASIHHDAEMIKKNLAGQSFLNSNFQPPCFLQYPLLATEHST